MKPVAWKHSCYNRQPFADSLWVMDGFIMQERQPDGSYAMAQRMRVIPAVGSKECHSGDNSCGDCKWRSTEARP